MFTSYSSPKKTLSELNIITDKLSFYISGLVCSLEDKKLISSESTAPII